MSFRKRINLQKYINLWFLNSVCSIKTKTNIPCTSTQDKKIGKGVHPSWATSLGLPSNVGNLSLSAQICNIMDL